MTPTQCLHPACREPRTSGSGWCPSHFSLIPGKLQTRFAYWVGQMLKNPNERNTEQFKTARQDCADAIQEALEVRG